MGSNRTCTVVSVRGALTVGLLLIAALPPAPLRGEVGGGVLSAQSALKTISHHRSFAASNYCIYPDENLPKLTPAPKGKKPFYISHYGRHGSRYLNDRKAFDKPLRMLQQADSIGQLTTTGRKVLETVQRIINDSENRWGDLTGFGHKQHNDIARRMTENFPEIFSGDAHIDARSTTVNRCILSMGAAMQELARNNQRLQISMEATKRDLWYMNFQDPLLRKNAMTPEAEQAYNAFSTPLDGNPRLMKLVFQEPDSVRAFVDEAWFNYYLIKMGLFQLNTINYLDTYLTDIFTDEEIHRLWQQENAWWYIQHGFCPLNGGRQPYTQRHLLRKIINDADSCLRLEKPGAQLRFGHETVLLPLTCLIGLKLGPDKYDTPETQFDLETADLSELERRGWWGTRAFPMGSNIQFIFYRHDPSDQDVLFKVLLNEREATLPIETDHPPYYRWEDFRKHYLKKLDDYEQTLK